MKKIGRPRIIESSAQMDRRVEEYVRKYHEHGEPLTLTGMILHLGFSSRQSWIGTENGSQVVLCRPAVLQLGRAHPNAIHRRGGSKCTEVTNLPW